MRKLIKKITLIMGIFAIILFSFVTYYGIIIPDKFYSNSNSEFNIESSILKTSSSNDLVNQVNNQTNKKNQISILGIIPIKNVDVNYVSNIDLIVSGDTFGIKMFTDGPIVVDIATIQTAQGSVSPASLAGIKKGDIINSINGIKVTSNKEVIAIIEEYKQTELEFKIWRNDELITTTLTPVLSSMDNKYKSGLWVRDSAAGIGTITYIDPVNNVFGGLGHPICDVDTGIVMSISEGEMCKVDINNIVKGVSGTPGELSGFFSQDNAIGNINLNNQTGVYGQLFEEVEIDENYLYQMGFKQEVKLGEAVILCKLDEEVSKEYNIDILSIDYNEKNAIKNMVIKITDEELINKTGGIVQGMSGTPIIQNGKLVGAISHVFVNDPTKGYAIFVENMYENSKNIEKFKVNVAF